MAEVIAAAGPDRLTGVRIIGVDEHRWAPRRRGTEGFVTLIIDLTPVHDGTGPARLLDLVPGRSAAALSTWLTDQPPAFRAQVEVIAMDGFGGYKTAAAEELPDATAVMDPFHVVALAGAKLDLIRQRIQQLTCGHRGRTGDPNSASGRHPAASRPRRRIWFAAKRGPRTASRACHESYALRTYRPYEESSLTKRGRARSLATRWRGTQTPRACKHTAAQQVYSDVQPQFSYFDLKNPRV